METVRVSHVVNKYYLICLSKQIKSNLFENVLSSDVKQVQLYWEVCFVRLDLLDVVLAALGHHIIVIELVF